MSASRKGVVLAAGLALSCSASPNLHLEGTILLAGSHDKLWCSVELRDEKTPRRTAGVIGVRADLGNIVVRPKQE